MRRDQIVLYGLGGLDTQYVAIEYSIVDNRRGIPIEARKRYLTGLAALMVCENPTVEHVYAIYNRKGLKDDYFDSAFDRHNSIESRYAFKNMLETEGILIC